MMLSMKLGAGGDTVGLEDGDDGDVVEADIQQAPVSRFSTSTVLQNRSNVSGRLVQDTWRGDKLCARLVGVLGCVVLGVLLWYMLPVIFANILTAPFTG